MDDQCPKPPPAETPVSKLDELRAAGLNFTDLTKELTGHIFTMVGTKPEPPDGRPDSPLRRWALSGLTGDEQRKALEQAIKETVDESPESDGPGAVPRQ